MMMTVCAIGEVAYARGFRVPTFIPRAVAMLVGSKMESFTIRTIELLGFLADASGSTPARPGLAGTPGMPGFAGRPGRPGFAGAPGRPGKGGWSSGDLESYFEN